MYDSMTPNPEFVYLNPVCTKSGNNRTGNNRKDRRTQ